MAPARFSLLGTLVVCISLFLLLSAGAPLAGDDGWSSEFNSPGMIHDGDYLSVNALAAYKGRLYAAVSTGLLEWGGSGWLPPEDVVGSVRALIVFDNALVVAGTILSAGGVPVNRIARWDGIAWSTFGDGFNDTVYALAVHQGELYASGRFTMADGFPASRIARWDGAAWQPLGAGLDHYGLTLTSWGDRLYVGGYFHSAGGVGAMHVASWYSGSWSPLGAGANHDVLALSVYGNQLIVGGNFTEAGGVAASGIARWNGVQWSTVGTGYGDQARVLASIGGRLYAGGQGLKYWNGSAWTAACELGWVPVGGGIVALSAWGQDLVIGGGFGIANGIVVNGVARWDGTSWSAMPAGHGMTSAVGALSLINDNLFAGGAFSGAGTTEVAGVARWTGTRWDSLRGGMWGANDMYFPGVEAFESVGDEVVAAGTFDWAGSGGLQLTNVARWNGDDWLALGEGLGEPQNWGVVCALKSWNGSLVAGGEFDRSGETQLSNVASWDGAGWNPLGAGVSGGRVTGLAILGTDLIACGSFTSAGGSPTARIASWDGEAWGPLGAGMNASVTDLCVYEGDLIAAGTFTLAGEVEAARIARWDGQSWSPLGLGMDGPVTALIEYHGTLVAGGSFNTAGGDSAHGLARWDGSNWTPLGTFMPEYAWMQVLSLAVQADTLWVGGDFWSVDGTPSANIARWVESATTSVVTVGAPERPIAGCTMEPNPFGSTVDIRFTLALPGPVSVAVYDVAGRRVRHLVADHLPAGSHGFEWDGRSDAGESVRSGIYFLRSELGKQVLTRRLVRLQ